MLVHQRVSSRQIWRSSYHISSPGCFCWPCEPRGPRQHPAKDHMLPVQPRRCGKGDEELWPRRGPLRDGDVFLGPRLMGCSSRNGDFSGDLPRTLREIEGYCKFLTSITMNRFFLGREKYVCGFVRRSWAPIKGMIWGGSSRWSPWWIEWLTTKQHLLWTNYELTWTNRSMNHMQLT